MKLFGLDEAYKLTLFDVDKDSKFVPDMIHNYSECITKFGNKPDSFFLTEISW